jgi:hypothetical protein
VVQWQPLWSVGLEEKGRVSSVVVRVIFSTSGHLDSGLSVFDSRDDIAKWSRAIQL